MPPKKTETATKSSDRQTVRFSPPATKAVKPVTRGTSFAAPKTMTNMQQARNDSTAGIKSPITRMPPQDRARIDSTNAVTAAANKKDREFRGFQARQAVAGRKSRGY